MLPETHVCGISAMITMPGKDRIIGTLDIDAIYNELSKTCEHVTIEGPLPSGTYVITVDCTWRNPGARTKLIRDLAEKYYKEETNE